MRSRRLRNEASAATRSAQAPFCATLANAPHCGTAATNAHHPHHFRDRCRSGRHFVASFPRPSGNATGFINYEPTIASKWLELLKEIAPRVNRVARMVRVIEGLATDWRIVRAIRPTIRRKDSASAHSSAQSKRRSRCRQGHRLTNLNLLCGGPAWCPCPGRGLSLKRSHESGGRGCNHIHWSCDLFSSHRFFD